MYNQPIRSDDENAIELLKVKAEKLRKVQEEMKKANKHFRDNNTMQGFNNTPDDKAILWDEKIWKSIHKVPYASWQLQNNYQNLSTVEKRLKSLEREESNDTADRQYDTAKYGFDVKENKDITRLQLFFKGKPKEEIRSKLKSYGFKWSPTNESWQRLLNNNARRSLDYFISFMEQQKIIGGMEM